MNKRIPEFLTKNERDNLLRQPNKKTLIGLRDFCILSLMLFTGLRRAEICGLKRGDLKVQDKKAYLYIFGKGKKWRKVKVNDLDLLNSLYRYFRKIGIDEKPEAKMFLNIRRRPTDESKSLTPAALRYLIPKYTKMAGIDKRITPHSLRHTFTTLTLWKGADLATVQKLAGHASIQTTSRYLHTTQERQDRAIERLSL